MTANRDEWAVLVHQSFMQSLPSYIVAFKVERETAKTLVGRAAHADRHPKENCIRGLTEAQAKDTETRIQGAVSFARDESRRAISHAMSIIHEERNGPAA